MSLKRLNQPAILIPLFCIATALEAGAALFYLLSIPADAKNAFILGYSLQRLIILSVFFFLLIIFAVCGLYGFRNPAKSTALWDKGHNSRQAYQAFGWAFVLLALLGWTGSFLPPERMGTYQVYFERLRPLFIWGCIAAVQALIVLGSLSHAEDEGTSTGNYRRGLRAYRPLLVFLGLLLALWGVIAITGIGVTADEIYWNDNGVPLLPQQVVIALVCGLGMLFLERAFLDRFESMGQKKRWQVIFFDCAIIFLLWACATWIWAREPLVNSYFSPGPYPPTYENYPFSDAAGYDISAQYALIGQGLDNGKYVDKPLYSAFLVLLHLVAGQDYQQVLNVQVAFFALLPGLLYLLGKALLGRPGGLIAAVLLIGRELNAIKATWMLLAPNVKLFLTEGLTFFALLIFIIFLVKWLRAPQNQWIWLILASGTLGSATLIRHNPWLLLPFLALFALLLYRRSFKKVGFSFLVILGTIFICILPWLWRCNIVYDGHYMYMFMPWRGVVEKQRYYVRRTPDPTATLAASTPEPFMTSPTITADETPSDPDVTPEPASPPQRDLEYFLYRYRGIAYFISNHFFHNLVSTAVVLPSTLNFDTLEQVIKRPSSFWDPAWRGQLSMTGVMLQCANLLVVAIGLVASWKRLRWAATIPGVILLAYSLATAVARTSAGRYILPLDWVGYFYFALGACAILTWIFRWLNLSPIPTEQKVLLPASDKIPERGRRFAWLPSSVVLAGFFLLGAIPPLMEVGIPLRYPAVFAEQLLKESPAREFLQKAGINENSIDSFLDSPNAAVYYGRGLYPRYYDANDGEPEHNSAYRVQDYPRLAFTLIGQHGLVQNILPLPKAPADFPNGSDTLVLGCDNQGIVDVLLVILSQPQQVILQRSPSSPLICPPRPPN